MNDTKITQAVESICLLGCSSVNAVIKTIESGKTVEGLNQFNEQEISIIVNELKAIMSVYNNKR